MTPMAHEPHAPETNEPTASLVDAWMEARRARLEHNKAISTAMRDRPKYGHDDYQAYQQTVMEPLITERTRLTAAEKDAKARMNA